MYREQNQWRVQRHGRRIRTLHGHHRRGFIDCVLQAQQGVDEATIIKEYEGNICKRQRVNLKVLGCAITIVPVGRRRIDLHSSNVFVDPSLHVDYLSRKRSFDVFSYGQANESGTLNASARIRMMSRRRNLNLFQSLNQSQSRTLSQTTRIR